MNKQSIKNNLSERHNSFISFIDNLTDEEFLSCKNEKWSAGN